MRAIRLLRSGLVQPGTLYFLNQPTIRFEPSSVVFALAGAIIGDETARFVAASRSGNPNMACRSRLAGSDELCAHVKEPIALRAINAYQEFKRRFEKWQR